MREWAPDVRPLSSEAREVPGLPIEAWRQPKPRGRKRPRFVGLEVQILRPWLQRKASGRRTRKASAPLSVPRGELSVLKLSKEDLLRVRDGSCTKTPIQYRKNYSISPVFFSRQRRLLSEIGRYQLDRQSHQVSAAKFL